MLKDNPEIALVLSKAYEHAKALKHQYITLEHLLYSMCCYRNFQLLLTDYGIDMYSLLPDLKSYIDSAASIKVPDGAAGEAGPIRTAAIDRVFQRAVTEALFSGHDWVRLGDVASSLMSETNSYASYIMLKYGIDRDKFIAFYEKNYKESVRATSPMPGTPGPTATAQDDTLSQYCINLNELAKAGKIDTVIGRKQELKEITQVLAKRNKSNVILVGDPGCGKTAIVEGLALNMSKGNVPKYLQDWTIWSLDIGVLLAGCKYRGDFEEKIVKVVNALSEQGKCILFVDEAHQMRGAGAGAGSGPDFATMIKPAISRGKIKVIASTTWEDFSTSFEKDRALMRRFYKMAVNEPSVPQCKEIMRGLRGYFEDFHGGKITDGALDAAVDYTVRYQTDKRLPDKAIDIIDSTCAKFKIEKAESWIVDRNDVVAEVAQAVRIPLDQMDGQKKIQFQEMPALVKSKVYGQDDVVDILMNKIMIAKAGLKNPSKPIGSFLLQGPTGVGKTYLAKTLSELLGMHLMRFDMSEYQEKHTISKLIGAPPGYVGHDDGKMGPGLLVGEIEKYPNSIILFDEIEKAHPDVVLVLLQMMDDGQINGSSGRQADCKNCIIMLTSNLGAAESEHNTVGFHTKKNDGSGAAIKDFFKPEFRNRLDAICYFHSLDDLSLRKIVVTEINLISNLLQDKDLTLAPNERLIDEIMARGEKLKNMGARPLERIVSDLIKLPLSQKLLFDDIKPHQIIVLDWKNDELTIKFRKVKKQNVSNVTAQVSQTQKA